MFKQYKKTLIISSVIILIPMLVGLLLWNQLPDTIATHWGTDGQPDGWSSKAFAIVGLPLFIFIAHWICNFATRADKRNHNQSKKALSLVFWICPLVSLFSGIVVYGSALGVAFDMVDTPFILLGGMFIVIGNYLPKCKPNSTIGIKIPWTLRSEENWNATHRFGGKVWVIGGILFFLMYFLPFQQKFPVVLPVMAVMVLLPTLYSYLYARKHA